MYFVGSYYIHNISINYNLWFQVTCFLEHFRILKTSTYARFTVLSAALQNTLHPVPQVRTGYVADRVAEYMICLCRPLRYDSKINSAIIAGVWTTPHMHSVHSAFCTNNSSANRDEMFDQQLINSFEIFYEDKVIENNGPR